MLSRKISETEVVAIADYIQEYSGIDFHNQLTVLGMKASNFCEREGLFEKGGCLHQLKKDQTTRQNLMNYLSTNESFFYREFEPIAQLVQSIKASSGHKRILCAPCANGEEPYSIAIALLEAGVDESRFEIIGIDISSEAVNRSKRARYKEKTLRLLPPALKERYFHLDDGKYALNEVIKKCARFECMNIFDPALQELGTFDIILSRNLLIYFDGPTRKKAQALFESRLSSGDSKVYYGHADLYQ